VRLNEILGERIYSVEDAAKLLLRHDVLCGTRLEALDEYRRVDLGAYDDFPLMEFAKANYTEYAVLRIRH
jgi:hypothetical protein